MTAEPLLDIRDHETHLLFKIHVLPRSSKNAVAGRHLDALKVKLTAPPVGGLANKMGIEFLAKQLKVSKRCLKIVSGETSRTKILRFDPPPASDKKMEVRRVKGRLTALARLEKSP